MDPNAGGKVQAVQAGRLEAGPKGLPGVGQAVRKGEVLAYVVPTAGAIERSNQLAQQAELRAARDLAARRVARLTELADTVPRKDIEAAESELQSLTQRLGAVGAGLATRDALVAPVSGVIASANAVAGQVVDARELVFEVVDPSRLRIEALAYDPAQAQSVPVPRWPWVGSACRCALWARRAACVIRRCRCSLRATRLCWAPWLTWQ
jgi:cobalt-zinc-cadmium efflux system membrane fusion protein